MIRSSKPAGWQKRASASSSRVNRDELVCSPRVASGLMRRIGALAREHREPRIPEYPLTARERQVSKLIADGRSNKEIAALMFIELATVKTHVHNFLEKLGVQSRGEAAALYRPAAGCQGRSSA